MNQVSSICRTLSAYLYPSRHYLLATWFFGALVLNWSVNIELLQFKEILYVFTMWPFVLWMVVFAWGHPDKNKHEKIQLFMLPYAAGSAIGLVALLPMTLFSIYKIYVHSFGS